MTRQTSSRSGCLPRSRKRTSRKRTPTRTSSPHPLHPRPYTISPQPSTLDSQPSTLNPQPSTLNPQPSTLSPQPVGISGAEHGAARAQLLPRGDRPLSLAEAQAGLPTPVLPTPGPCLLLPTPGPCLVVSWHSAPSARRSTTLFRRSSRRSPYTCTLDLIPKP